MRHESIYSLYPNVKSIDEDTAYDADGNIVSWDATAVATKEAELIAAFKLTELRTERNRLLAETDWWDASDTPDMTDEQKKYRQDLRDITKIATSLDDVTWPTKP